MGYLLQRPYRGPVDVPLHILTVKNLLCAYSNRRMTDFLPEFYFFSDGEGGVIFCRFKYSLYFLLSYRGDIPSFTSYRNIVFTTPLKKYNRRTLRVLSTTGLGQIDKPLFIHQKIE